MARRNSAVKIANKRDHELQTPAQQEQRVIAVINCRKQRYNANQGPMARSSLCRDPLRTRKNPVQDRWLGEWHSQADSCLRSMKSPLKPERPPAISF